MLGQPNQLGNRDPLPVLELPALGFVNFPMDPFGVLSPRPKACIEYVQMDADCGLEVQWQGPGITRQPIAAIYLEH